MKKMFGLIWIGLGMVAMSACFDRKIDVVEGGRADGKILVVEEGAQAGLYVALDIDNQEHVHMVYFDKKSQVLKYATQTGEGFEKDVVDPSCVRCLFGTIAVDKDARPHLAYYSDAEKTLIYARKVEGAWHRESIEWGDGIGMGAKLLFDHQGGLHALYYSQDGYLKHAWRSTGKPKAVKDKTKPGSKVSSLSSLFSWENERIDKANGSDRAQISFRRQPKGRLAASYFHWSGFDSELRVALEGLYDTWTIEVVEVENNPGKSSSLFFTPNGEPRIVFREARKDILSFGEPKKGGWKNRTLVENAYNMALASHDSGDILIAYLKMPGNDPRKGHLCAVRYSNESWSRFDVDTTSGSGTYLDAALTKQKKPVIAYYEDKTESLKIFVGK